MDRTWSAVLDALHGEISYKDGVSWAGSSKRRALGLTCTAGPPSSPLSNIRSIDKSERIVWGHLHIWSKQHMGTTWVFSIKKNKRNLKIVSKIYELVTEKRSWNEMREKFKYGLEQNQKKILLTAQEIRYWLGVVTAYVGEWRLIFREWVTDVRTNGWTDTPSYSDARIHLIMFRGCFCTPSNRDARTHLIMVRGFCVCGSV